MSSETIVFDVVPHSGAGEIRLGMTRRDVRRLLGEPARSYYKVPGATLTDTYFGSDLQVAYDAADRVEYIELDGPGAIDAVFHGGSLLNVPAEEVRDWMKQFAEYDPDDPELGYSYVYPTLDLSLWRPVLPENPDDNEGRFFRSVGVGRSGYFDRGGQSSVETERRL